MSDQIQSRYQLLSELIQGLLSGELSEEHFRLLSRMLSEDPKNLEYYIEYATLWALLDETSEFQAVDTLPSFDSPIWAALAEEERTAETIELPTIQIQPELIQRVERKRIGPKLTRGSLLATLAAAAAMVFLIMFARFAPAPKGLQVAVLSDSINAKWADMDGGMEKGASLATGMENLLLREGYAELLFNNDTRVTLEGPAEFQILTEDQIRLRYGRLYAVVPREAIGFTVTTQTAKVIDLGTEFGIEANLHGDTYLCVTKGKTSLIAGDKSNKSNIEVGKGIAKKISGITQAVSDAVFEDRLFVRSIDSAQEILWRGQTGFNLADVVGGGNGFGTGRFDEGISLSDGAMKSDYHGVGLKGTGDYVPVPGSAFVDGVFVPGVGLKPVRISSQGHIFKECPSTSGLYTVLRNGGIAKELEGTVYPLELKGQVCGTPENPVLSLRSNAGITFDLNAVRNAVPGCEVQAFRSTVGISSNAEQVSKIDRKEVNGEMIDVYTHLEGRIGKADISVLVDGELRQTATVTHDPATIVNLDIKLIPQNRFLTLVSTESDKEWTYDWVMFAKPLLILNTAE